VSDPVLVVNRVRGSPVALDGIGELALIIRVNACHPALDGVGHLAWLTAQGRVHIAVPFERVRDDVPPVDEVSGNLGRQPKTLIGPPAVSDILGDGHGALRDPVDESAEVAAAPLALSLLGLPGREGPAVCGAGVRLQDVRGQVEQAAAFELLIAQARDASIGSVAAGDREVVVDGDDGRGDTLEE